MCWRALFLPLPATHEWGEDRGEGLQGSLLSPTLSSIRWRRGSRFSPGGGSGWERHGQRSLPTAGRLGLGNWSFSGAWCLEIGALNFHHRIPSVPMPEMWMQRRHSG